MENSLNTLLFGKHYRMLVDMISKHGVHHDKAQGQWVILEYLPGHIFLLDTWGSIVSLYRMKDSFNYVYSDFCGIKEDNTVYKKHIGANVGEYSPGFSAQIDLELLLFYIIVLQLCLSEGIGKTPVSVGVDAAKKYLSKYKKLNFA